MYSTEIKPLHGMNPATYNDETQNRYQIQQEIIDSKQLLLKGFKAQYAPWLIDTTDLHLQALY